MIDKKYNELVNKILTEGKEKMDRTGTGTISIFNAQIEHNMTDGFPLLTCKKMYVGGIIHELLWFLNGDTNIKYLVDNGVNIWTSDAYREYKNYAGKLDEPDYDFHVDDPNQNCTRLMTFDEFTQAIKDDYPIMIHTSSKTTFAKKFGELGPIYGKQWVSWGTKKQESVKTGELYPSGEYKVDIRYKSINQIQQAIDKLNNNPEDRRIMVSAWNVGEMDKMVLPPCHWAFELYTEELAFEERKNLIQPIPNVFSHEDLDVIGIPKRRLSLKWHQRSVDTFLGLPFNIASYGLLLHMLAQQTNMVAGTLIGDLTNVHIYQNHIEQCKEQIGREPLSLPSLKLEKAKDIFSYCYGDVKIDGYVPHEPIKGDISV
jgi:thymidylate synthase